MFRTSTRTKSGHAVGSCQKCGAGHAYKDLSQGSRIKCSCGARVKLEFVLGEFSETPCNGSCMGAVGPNCSCACGGANHGKWFLPLEYVATWKPDEQAKAHAARAKRTTDHAARLQAKRDAAARVVADGQTALLAEAPTLAALLTDRYADTENEFATAMRRAFTSGYMSPRQVKAAADMIARDARRDAQRIERDARDAAAKAAGVRVPTGRVTFSGVIVGYTEKENTYRYNGGTIHKITVQSDDGWTVYGTLPDALTPTYAPTIADEYIGWPNRVRGQRVTLTATLAPKPDGDGLFGFFSRPTVPAGTPRLSHLGPDAQTDPTQVARVTAAVDAERARMAPVYAAEARRAETAADEWAAYTGTDVTTEAPAATWADAHAQTFNTWAAAAAAYTS